MKLLDVSERFKREEKEAEAIFKKTLARAKVLHVHLGHTELHNAGSGKWIITIESDLSGMKHGFGDEIEEIIKKAKLATFVSKEEHKGQFDWASDTYIKDASVVTFKF